MGVGQPGADSLFGRQVELFVITGYSGAGKSEAIAAFEDSGFFCVDNLPPRLIARSASSSCTRDGVRRAAVVTDVRGGDYFADLLAVLEELSRGGHRPQGAVPRGQRGDPRQPVQGDAAPASAGARRPDRRRDPGRARGARARCASGPTSSSTRPASPGRCCGAGSPPTCWAGDEPAKLALTILTFGFKNGPPRDADLVFDVRFLPNPHYREDLRPLTGRDAAVVEHVEAGDARRRVLPAAAAAARLPPARLRRRGQAAPDDRDRLHRRSPPLGHGGRADRCATSPRATTISPRVVHRDVRID